MIVNIEKHEDNIIISYIETDGSLQFMDIPIPPAEKFVWRYCKPGQKAHKMYRSWDDKPVRKQKSKYITKYRVEEILENQPQHIKDKLYAQNQPKLFFCDIEVEVTNDGFPMPHLAKNPVTAIAFCNGDKVVVLGTKKLTATEQGNIKGKINNHFKDFYPITFKYIYFKTEYDMLYSFFAKAIHKMPLITGWNFNGFDWPYLINRCKKLSIDPAISSPSLKLTGREELPLHRMVVDYYRIYKTWDRMVEVKENNSLDFVSKAVLGLNKIKYPGTLQDLYEHDFSEYIFYNAVDTLLVQHIHEKIKTMQTFLTLANITKVEAQRAFSPIWMAESVICRSFYSRGKIFPQTDNKNRKRESYEGGYVFKPVAGMYEWVGAFDFTSLYPFIIQQWNISPESYIRNLKKDEPIPKNCIPTISGAIFENKEDSVFRSELSYYYKQRKVAKNIMQSIEREIETLKGYIK